MDMELRMHNAELRSNDDGTMTVSGYVNKTGQLSEVLGGAKRFKEKIMPGAFESAIKQAKRDIDFLAEHNTKLILASTRNSSLQLHEDEQGLFMSATISPTSWGKDYYQLIKDGILQNMSFGFRSVKDSWRPIEPGLYERTIDQLELFEVSVVRDPAYSQSTIASRGIDVIEDVEIPAELLKQEEEERAMDEKLTAILEELRSTKELVETLSAEIRELKAPEKEDEEVREGEAVLTEGTKIAGAKEEKEEERKSEDESETDDEAKEDPKEEDKETPDEESKEEDEENKKRSIEEANAELRSLLDSLKK